MKKARLKVIHTLWSCNFGGIENLVYDLVTQQVKKAGFYTSIVFGKKEGEFYHKFIKSGTDCYFIDLKNGFDVRPRKIWQVLRLFWKYDIIHMHIFNLTFAIASLLAGKSVVFTEHGVFGFGRIKTWRDDIKKKLKRLFLKNFVNYITYNSNFTKNTSLALYSTHNVQSQIIYNGINLKSKKLNSSGVNLKTQKRIQDKFVVGTVEPRFAGFKRIDRLISAYARFCKNKYDTILLLVGDGPLKSKYKVLTEKIDISANVSFAGYQQNVQEYESIMDLFVLPSENEPFGLVAVEALFLGKVVIVFSDGGGVVELISDINPIDIVSNEDELAERLEYYYQNRYQLTLEALAKEEPTLSDSRSILWQTNSIRFIKL